MPRRKIKPGYVRIAAKCQSCKSYITGLVYEGKRCKRCWVRGLDISDAKARTARFKRAREREAFQLPALPGVYFMRCATLIKIGHASKLNERTTDIASPTDSPFKSAAVGYMVCEDTQAAITVERALHQLFKRDRFRGEWFYASPSLVEYIQQHAIAAPKAFQVTLDKGGSDGRWILPTR